MVSIVIAQPLAAAFVRPVDPALVPGYSDVVSKPMDLVRLMGQQCSKCRYSRTIRWDIWELEELLPFVLTSVYTKRT